MGLESPSPGLDPMSAGFKKDVLSCAKSDWLNLLVIQYRLKFYLNPHKKGILESSITRGDMPHKNQLYWPYFVHS